MKFGKYFLTFLLLGFSATMWGQAAEAPAPSTDTLPKIMTYALVSVAALLFIVAMIYVIKVNQFLYKRILNMQGQQVPGAAGTSAAPVEDDMWTTFKKKFWEDAVPIEREGEILSHHDFDGIRELDNSLPPWWVNMFIITVIWGVIYMFYYHWGGNGPSSAEEYKMEMEAAKKSIATAQAAAGNVMDESSVTALTDAAALGDGELIFKTNCAACHGQKGEGLVGPNLTDDYWIHGGGIKNVFKTIKVGVPEKGMISWASQLKPSDIQKVSSYILSLHGTNPPNPKEPQGTIWKEETAAPADTVKQEAAPAGSK